MIKIIYCITRKAGLTPEQFHDYWLNQHGRSVVDRAAEIGMIRYVQNHTTHTTLGESLAQDRGAAEPYDGVMEAWFESEEAAVAAFGSDGGRAALEYLLADEVKIMDFSRSRMFTCSEVVWEFEGERGKVDSRDKSGSSGPAGA